MRRVLFAAVVLAALGVVGYCFMPLANHSAWADRSERTITIAGMPVAAEVVSTDASREQGLSGRAGLAPNSAMLFVFDTDSRWGFWMKDMQFNIDIVWLAADGSVITVAPDVAAGSYPQIFYPAAPARYAVELPAGFAAAHNLAVGDRIVL